MTRSVNSWSATAREIMPRQRQFMTALPSNHPLGEISMKKNKSQRKETFMDALLELVITLVLFGLGALVLTLCDIDVGAVDGDLLCIIGVGVFALLGGVIWVAEILKKKKKPSKKSDKNADNADGHF